MSARPGANLTIGRTPHDRHGPAGLNKWSSVGVEVEVLTAAAVLVRVSAGVIRVVFCRGNFDAT